MECVIMVKKKYDTLWPEAKKRCRLNEADVKMAKELGLTPKSLLKNIHGPNQKWKAPVKLWIREMYEDKFGKVLSIHNGEPKQPKRQAEKQPDPFYDIDEEDLPF